MRRSRQRNIALLVQVGGLEIVVTRGGVDGRLSQSIGGVERARLTDPHQQVVLTPCLVDVSAIGQRLREGLACRLVAQRQQAGAFDPQGALLLLAGSGQGVAAQKQRQRIVFVLGPRLGVASGRRFPILFGRQGVAESQQRRRRPRAAAFSR